MKPLALFALFTGLAASIAVIVMTIKSIVKTGKATKGDKIKIACISLFALVLIGNIVITFLYF